jgi:hypothetical protein
LFSGSFWIHPCDRFTQPISLSLQGDVSCFEAGHDGSVVGDDPVVVVDIHDRLDDATGSRREKSQNLLENLTRLKTSKKIQAEVESV